MDVKNQIIRLVLANTAFFTYSFLTHVDIVKASLLTCAKSCVKSPGGPGSLPISCYPGGEDEKKGCHGTYFMGL